MINLTLFCVSDAVATPVDTLLLRLKRVVLETSDLSATKFRSRADDLGTCLYNFVVGDLVPHMLKARRRRDNLQRACGVLVQ